MAARIADQVAHSQTNAENRYQMNTPMADVGRPSVYGADIIDKSVEYLNRFEEKGDVYPSLAGLALHIGVTRKTVHVWMQDENKPEFCYIAESILAKQEHSLTNNGLTGKFNSSITKLLLSKHGYSDKSEITGGDGKPLIPDSNIDTLEMARRIAYELQKANKELDDATDK